MSQQEWPRDYGRAAEPRDLNDAWRPSQSKDQLDTRPPETATGRENVQQGKAMMPHPMQKIDMEVSHTLHKNRRIQQNNYSGGKRIQ